MRISKPCHGLGCEYHCYPVPDWLQVEPDDKWKHSLSVDGFLSSAEKYYEEYPNPTRRKVPSRQPSFRPSASPPRPKPPKPPESLAVPQPAPIRQLSPIAPILTPPPLKDAVGRLPYESCVSCKKDSMKLFGIGLCLECVAKCSPGQWDYLDEDSPDWISLYR
jgi:hypothetical protein